MEPTRVVSTPIKIERERAASETTARFRNSGRIASLNVNAAAGALLYAVLHARAPLDRTP